MTLNDKELDVFDILSTLETVVKDPISTSVIDTQEEQDEE